jgi:GWxTD domain-containing protein
MHRPSLLARLARLAPVALVTLTLGACASGGSGRSTAELMNPFLGPETSSWLIGPIARIATPDEIKAYLALTEEAQATAFIDQFWAKRNSTPGKDNPLRKAFEQRAAQADHVFTEAGYRGRRTDRGTLYILYGPPSKSDFDVSPVANGSPLEVWTYAPTTPEGLDGKRPNATYRFIKKGDLTVLYVPGQDPRLRQRMDSGSL